MGVIRSGLVLTEAGPEQIRPKVVPEWTTQFRQPLGDRIWEKSLVLTLARQTLALL
jgi:hypothetical protein